MVHTYYRGVEKTWSLSARNTSCGFQAMRPGGPGLSRTVIFSASSRRVTVISFEEISGMNPTLFGRAISNSRPGVFKQMEISGLEDLYVHAVLVRLWSIGSW